MCVDGNKIPEEVGKRMGGRVEAVVKGDSKVRCIAAASVLAKVTRDRIMVCIHTHTPTIVKREGGVGVEV